MDKLERLKNIVEAEKFDIHKKLIRFSLINRESELTFSNFYNVDNNDEVLTFIENIVIPSAAMSILTEENGDIIVTIEDSDDFIELFKSYGAEDKLVKKCERLYHEINKFKTTKKFEYADFTEFLDHISFELTEDHFILISLEYAEDTPHYLNHMYHEYKEMNHLDILEQELAKMNLCIGGFLDICAHTDKYEHEIKEKLLDLLPY